MKPAIVTFEAKKPPAAVRRRSAKAVGYADYYAPRKGRDGGMVFAWSVIGFTSTLIMFGFAFFAYVFTHLP